MYIQSVTLKNFRCFSAFTLDFDSPITLIEGANASGKTSLLEALHYACYLRSFRTHLPREMLAFGQDTFVIKVHGTSSESDWNLHVGFSGKKRLIKIDEKHISSYKELVERYRVISSIEDDLMLIKGGPDIRRTFMDQSILLENPTLISTMRRYSTVVDQRNALLAQPGCDSISYDIWTQQLWELSALIQAGRKQFLSNLEREVNILLEKFFEVDSSITLEYCPKRCDLTTSYESFRAENPTLFQDERLFRRSLFGVHLDDCRINFLNKSSKTYASRGQQKLLILLIKVAQLRLLNNSVIIILDDFMTDFDDKNSKILLDMLISLNVQIILTCPTEGLLRTHLSSYTHQRVKLP